MAITNGYLTLEEFKTRMGVSAEIADTTLERAVEAASRQVDGITGRSFYSVTEVRYFRADRSNMVIVDDITAVTTLQTDPNNDRTYNVTWAATDFELGDGVPATSIYAIGAQAFPTNRRGVKINGTWGFTTVPSDVKEATALFAARLWKRKDAPFGVMGADELGQMRTITKLDPDAVTLLQPWLKFDISLLP